MKKILSFVAAALMSASMFAQPATVPTVTDLTGAGYDLTGRVICLYFDEQVCNDIVWAGSYNEWSTTPIDMMPFEPLEGFDGWYVIELWDPSDPCQGRPVQLKKDGSFSWDFQSGDPEAWINMAQPGTKTATIVAGDVKSESNCTWPTTGAYIYEVAYFKNHNTPCGADKPKHYYTITAYLPEFCAEIEDYADSVRVVGSFDNWTDGVWMQRTVDEDFNDCWTATLNDVEEGTEFKLRFGTDADWKVQVQLDGKNLDNMMTGETTDIILQFDGEGYGFAACAAPEYKYTEYENWQLKHEGSEWTWTENLVKVEDGVFKLADANWTGSGFNVGSDANPIKKDWFDPEELVLGEEVIAPIIVDVYLVVVDDETVKIGIGVIPVTDPAPELTAPQVPTVAAANVKAIMCETYNNDLGYWPQGWGGCSWVDTCKAGVNFKYAKTMAWDCFASDFAGAGAAGYANLHFDIWFAEDGNAPVIKLEFNGTDPTAEITIPGEYKAGWNSVNVNVAETFGEQPMNDLKCLDVKVTKEGGPVAWANILFFNGTYTSTEATGTCGETPVWPEDAPTTAPAAPTVDGASILGAALTTSYAFEPLDWPGAMPQLLTFETGETIYYMERMTWQIYTNWAEDSYDVSEYNMLHVDLYPATGTKIKVAFEALDVDDGGSGYRNGVVKTLTAGQWNGLDIALSEFPALTSGDPYDFSDIRYFTLEGYNAEQTALTVGNVYFYSGPTALPNVDSKFKIQNSKLIINGQLIIRKGGKHFNALGAEVK